jgi:hypothetical protein
VSDFAESLFEDLAPPPPAEYYPGSKRQVPPKNTPTPPAAPTEKPWDRNPKRLTVRGVEREFFTIGALAEAINRRPVTIRAWEDRGVIPKARYRGRGQKRLYTREQVEGLVRLCDEHGILTFASRPDSIPPAFTSDVIELWKQED